MFDFYAANTMQAWDFAASMLLIQEAGGKVTDREGKEQRYDKRINGALITNGTVHKNLLKILVFK